MRVAIVHEWLATYAGSERVVGELLRCFPAADLFAVVDFLPPAERGFLGGRPVHTSFVQRLPWARRHFRRYLALMPLAVEQFDLSGYDLVLSSSHAVAKGVLTGPHQVHVCYCHSPMRYAWDGQHEYLRAAGLERGPGAWLARWMLHRLRLWDLRAAAGVDVFVANSRHIAHRIRKHYRRRAAVIHPPVELAVFPLREAKDDFYLAAARMVPYKRVDLVVAAFARMPARRLVVIGDGPEARRVRALAGPNVTFLGQVAPEVLGDHLGRARALVHAAEEDFGITLAEAQACGTPVIAYGRGGARDIVRDARDEAPTGLFFAEQTPEALCAAVERFEREREAYRPAECRRNAERFAPEVFRGAMEALVARCTAHLAGTDP